MNTRYLQAANLAMLVLLFAALAPWSYAQTIDNKGTDFITTFNVNTIDGPPIVEVHLTAVAATNVTIQYPVNSPTFTTTVAVGPGAITVVALPATASSAWSANAVANNAVRAFAPIEFVAYTVNRLTYTSDAGLALPIDAFNTEYIVATYPGVNGPDQFSVVAAFNNTDVTITPSTALVGRPAGVPFTVSLNRGEGYYGQAASNGPSNDLTGTLIQATRPVGMTNGSYCTNIPGSSYACDHIYEVAQPTVSWGTEALAAPLPQRTGGSIYRVLSAANGTTVSRNGVAIGTINKGEFIDTGIVAGGQYFTATGPIFVIQYMTGVSSAGATSGDPAMGNMAPSAQYQNGYTFSTIDGAFSQHFLSVIASNADATAGLVLFDGVAIPSGDFTAIAGSPFSYAVRSIVSGSHTTSSPTPHGITVEGYNNANSYIYPGGALFQFINQAEDLTAPICTGLLAGTTFNGTATDLVSTDPDNTGIFFVVLGPGSTNLTLTVAPFTPGDGSVSYAVTLTDPNQSGSGTVIATDGAGNTCPTPVSISVGPPTDRTAPVCGSLAFDMSGNGSVFSTVSDPESGIASVRFTLLNNLTGHVSGAGPFTVGPTYNVPGTPPSIQLRGTRINPAIGRAGLLAVITNGAGLTRVCDPVIATMSTSAEATSLLPPTPNPSVGNAHVPFTLAEATAVRISVYDALGREVYVLADSEMSPGSYEVVWDGRDTQGRSLSTGVYLVRMTTGTSAQTQRITLIR